MWLHTAYEVLDVAVRVPLGNVMMVRLRVITCSWNIVSNG